MGNLARVLKWACRFVRTAQNNQTGALLLVMFALVLVQGVMAWKH